MAQQQLGADRIKKIVEAAANQVAHDALDFAGEHNLTQEVDDLRRREVMEKMIRENKIPIPRR